jgi:ADP-L-glycero-D-manno-heptose 6-epimerase
VPGVYKVGTGTAQAFNDVALAVVNSLREHDGGTPLKLEQAVHQGLIEYVAFPEGLKTKYQAYTQADLSNLRAGGCDVEFQRVEQGTASYIRWLLAQAS